MYLSNSYKKSDNAQLIIKKNNIKYYLIFIKNSFVFFNNKKNIFINTLLFVSKKTLIAYSTHYAILFVSSSIKYICVYFIRKFKVFNKGRYSRTRQLYRTGVY